ncbi:alpha-hydroxy-acid oxidizing protein [Desulfonatronovibrio magnus]|uniref:alpha-hydroxy-acid oxidizing protein n=1 Tax=Desulfonatronovibrio magnus TaxID=698827 RepID=UPI0005EB0ACC|nr:alpha-hydroxy-acid oxidizing protein [Desulfonatronovibrio magnus]
MSLDFDTINAKARERLKGFCRVCPVCDGRHCSGQVPGMGGVGSGTAFRENLHALARYRLRMKTIHDVREPDTKLDLWGQILSMPIMAAPMTGVSYNMGGDMSEESFIDGIVEGCMDAGTIGWSGDGADPAMFESGLKAIEKNNGSGIPIIKPRAQDEIIKRIRSAEKAGAIAVGMDIDGAGLVTMALKGQAVGPKSTAELKELVQECSLPFILKGVMTPEDALSALEAGVSAIVVSNHGGRVLDYTPGSADVLSEISSLVRGRMIVMADGGVRFGADVLKLLALGADAVMVGRPLIAGLFGGGTEGVGMVLNKMKNELIQSMLLTGTQSTTKVCPKIIHK